MSSSKNRLRLLIKNRRQTSISLWLVIWAILLQRLLPLLLRGSPDAWVINDVARSISYVTLSFYVASIVPYSELRIKCIMAAIFGYSVADLLSVVLFYWIHPITYIVVNIIQAQFVVFMIILYAVRSYHQASFTPEPSRIYCIRKKPKSLQGLIIAMFGSLGAQAGYSIYCNGNVYKFTNGVLERVKYTASMITDCHVSKGGEYRFSREAALNKMVGAKWSLFGKSCITTLARFWRNNAA